MVEKIMLAQTIQTLSGQWTIDPTWVLAVIAGASGFLLWTQIRDIKDSIKEMVKEFRVIAKQVTENDKRITLIEEKIKRR